jgi:hypothetical protein
MKVNRHVSVSQVFLIIPFFLFTFCYMCRVCFFLRFEDMRHEDEAHEAEREFEVDV